MVPDDGLPGSRRQSMPRVELRFQDAGGSTGNLLEELLVECATASQGGAIFAWTNASGTRSFLDDPVFKRFIRRGRFDLVVGLDSITDEAAVKALVDAEASASGLSVRAFLHDRSEMFHPKLAWFGDATALTLLVGSGNLTMGGLKNNWEAFTIARLVGTDAKAAHDEIARWIGTWDAILTPIGDPRVAARAKENSGNERSLKRAPRTSAKVDARVDAVLGVLVAEVPRSGSRPTQVNFDQRNFEDFFGVSIRAQSRISLYHVRSDGTLGDVESRPSVARASKNYSFELAGMYGIPGSGGMPPIGVYLGLEPGTFLYMILAPGSAGYAEVDSFLSAHWSGPARQMRRVPTTAAELRAAWPTSPLWTARLPAL
jgi:hypothetical protein